MQSHFQELPSQSELYYDLIGFMSGISVIACRLMEVVAPILQYVFAISSHLAPDLIQQSAIHYRSA